jgi:CheY-like chemotaxis protein
MLTSVLNLNRCPDPRTTGRDHRSEVRKVVIVNGEDDVLDMLESVLDGTRYEVTLVDSPSQAYPHIRSAQPHLVILCVRIDDAETLRVLSMLKLDTGTRDIPVLTFTVEDTVASDGSGPIDALPARRAVKRASQLN